MDTVSLARMPSLCSILVTVAPGVPASTTKERIPARPAFGSIVAQTTIKPSDSIKALCPAVTKIFSPLRTHSLVSSSNTAVARMAEVSDPAWGSVMHMASKTGLSPMNRLRNFFFCSEVPAALTAAAPNMPPGRHRYIPASPQASISTMVARRWKPIGGRFSLGSSPSFLGLSSTAIDVPPIDLTAVCMKLMKFQGMVCSFSSNSRETGRIILTATVSTTLLI